MSIFENAANIYIFGGQFIAIQSCTDSTVYVQRTEVAMIDAKTLGELGAVASSKQIKNDWEKTEMLRTQEAEGNTLVYGREHPKTTESMRELVAVYQARDKWDEVRNLEKELLEIWMRTSCFFTVEALRSLENLRLACEKLSLWAEAEVYKLKEEEVRRVVNGAIGVATHVLGLVDSSVGAGQMIVKHATEQWAWLWQPK